MGVNIPPSSVLLPTVRGGLWTFKRSVNTDHGTAMKQSCELSKEFPELSCDKLIISDYADYNDGGTELDSGRMLGSLWHHGDEEPGPQPNQREDGLGEEHQ